ncbi:GerAB/ArcD/ProY family transporter [Paenibacillus sp. D2_2]|uniref:GerAB/ArcD/ProY family transporter n=1 Tax=Paenibacillus sp. D2_2 TaxID=3073092 RepID=UPI0028149E01|nr:GerAB/ArcD/ProY family transporter [Paenibacillus sp. D2_2]WMT42868.1 GerAB/ArcD/ProY family transporter [Paenibacillus sp. D2_2]
MQKISSLQIFSLFTVSMYTTFTAFLENSLASASGFSSLLSTLLAALLACLLLYPAIKVTKSRSDEFIINYGHELVGKWLHTILVIIVILTNALLGAATLRQMSDFLLSEYLVGTPSWAILLIFSLVAAYAVYSGLSTIFRAAQGIFLLSVLSNFLIPILASGEINKPMLPAFLTHINPVELGSGIYLNISLFGEISFYS